MTGVVMMSRTSGLAPGVASVVVLMALLPWTGLEPLHGGGQVVEQVARHHALGAHCVLGRKVGGETVQVGAEAGGVGGRQALGELGSDDAGEDVAGARRGEAGVAGRDDVGPSRRSATIVASPLRRR